jgi:hypothetical protein
MDLGASTAFVMEPIDSDALARPPQSARARFFDREMLTWIATPAGCMAACVLSCYEYGQAMVSCLRCWPVTGVDSAEILLNSF